MNDENEDYHDAPPPPCRKIPNIPTTPTSTYLSTNLLHDENNLYAYFRRGVVGRTQQQGQGNGAAGRYYVIVTIDVDNQDTTGYELRGGGYWIYPDWPFSGGYDMNMELEFYNGSWNTGHYLSHDALTTNSGRPGHFRFDSGQMEWKLRVRPYTPVEIVQPATPGITTESIRSGFITRTIHLNHCVRD